MKITTEKEGLLLEILQEAFPQSSKSTLRSWIKNERVFVDGKKALLTNQQIKKGALIERIQKRHPLPGGIKVLFSDQHLVVIDKPNGLLSVATPFETTQSAHAILKTHFHPKKVYVVHRIDQDTSGVMLFALSEEAYLKLKAIFKAHDLLRMYTAIVEGKMKLTSGTWRSYLKEDRFYKVHTSQEATEGELAITHYEVKKSSPKKSLLHLILETGKKNQIRVHCQAAGHPIVGDKKYGALSNPIKRVCLHATVLAFKHPLTQKPLRFESSLPEEFSKLISL